MTIDSSSLLGDPGAFAVTNHRAWIGRKEAKLRRHLLDCGCRNLGEVFFHLWCDRLACREHADAPHDCEQFKGKNGIEEESALVEAAVDVTVMPAAQFDDLMATIDEPDDAPALRAAAQRRRLTLADMEEASAAVRARRVVHGRVEPDGQVHPGPGTFLPLGEVSIQPWTQDGDGRVHLAGEPPPVDAALEPEPGGADVRMMTPEEEAGYLLRQTWSLECSRARPMCSGCDGGAVDGFTCMHDCHGFEAQDTELRAASERLVEAIAETLPPVPWWRRMLGGGTR